MRSVGILAVLMAVGFAGRDREPQEPRPVFPAETELVTVDAVVIDRDGVPVRGLRASDFALSEDGVRQEIAAFEAVDLPEPAVTAGPAATERVPLPPVSSHDFDVPPLAGLRISTPVLSDRLREGAGPDLIARRTFAPAGVLHCAFEVYGAAKDPATGRPAVSAGFAVRRADGTLLAAAGATRITPGPDGILARTVGVSLGGASAGSYEMIVVVEDEVSRRTAEARAPFVVDPAGS